MLYNSIVCVMYIERPQHTDKQNRVTEDKQPAVIHRVRHADTYIHIGKLIDR